MAPGITADQDDVGTTSPKSVSAQSAPATTFDSDKPPTSSIAAIQETWEDMRDAVMETDLYISARDKASAVSRTASSLWSLSKKVAWVVGTSALVIVLPLLYEIDKELGPGFDPSAPAAAPSPGADAASAPKPSSTPAAGADTTNAASS